MRALLSIIIFCFCFCALHFTANAQSRLLKDTVYYLADTSRVPKNDRMITIYPEAGLICFEIACPCLRDGQKPVLRYNIKDRLKKISPAAFKRIKLISLPDLIKDIKEIVDSDYKERHVINILEPEGDLFKMHIAGVEPLSIKTRTDDGCCAVKKP